MEMNSQQSLDGTSSLELELKKSIQELMDFKFALDESSIVAITDSRGIITYVNEQFIHISKYTKDELIGQDHRILNSGYHSEEFLEKCGEPLVRVRFGKVKFETAPKTEVTIGWILRLFHF